MMMANDDEIMTWNDPGTVKMYVLYIEHPVHVPNAPFHDRGTYKECVAVFDSMKTLDEYTLNRFGVPYSDRLEFERMQREAIIRYGSADGMFLENDSRYGVDEVPMFTDIKRIPEYAKKMAKWDSRFKGGVNGSKNEG
jgi:hypothetical protein